MGTISPVLPSASGDDASFRRADTAVALEQFAKGCQLDSGLLERVRTRAAQVTADIQRKHGLVDDDTFQQLLDDEA